MKPITFILLLAVVLSACAPAATPTPVPPTATPIPPTATVPPPTATLALPTATTLPPELIADLDATLAKLAEAKVFAGSALIAHQGKVLLSKGYGLADRKQNIPNTAQTRFRIASITKQFTAMAILILASQGKLNVKDSICKYISDCPSAWGGITIHQLLTHTSGIPDWSASPYFSDTTHDVFATPSAPEETIARFKNLPLTFQPGEKMSYSSPGYIVLGYIIDRASGQSYEEFLKQSIFDPLNLRDTGYDHNSNGLALGYLDQYASVPVPYLDMSIPYAAGALFSTVEDLYRWEQALSTEQLVPQAYLDQMFTPYAVVPADQAYPYGSDWAYGYGWNIGQVRDRRIIMHEGNLPGFFATIAWYPDYRLTLILLSNQEHSTIRVIQDILTKKIFGDQ